MIHNLKPSALRSLHELVSLVHDRVSLADLNSTSDIDKTTRNLSDISWKFTWLSNRGGMGVVGGPGYSNSTNVVGGSIPGILPTSAAIGNRNSIPGVNVSPMLTNSGPRITNSTGNIIGGGNIGRTLIPSGGGLSIPVLSSRLNLNTNNGYGNVNVEGSIRLMDGMLQQASPQVMSMFRDLIWGC